LIEGLKDGTADLLVVPLHLSLTHADWQAVKRKCRTAYTQQGWGIAFVLQGNLLFLMMSGGACGAIFRFAACENRYEVVEITYLDGDLWIDDGSHEWFIECLACLLPGHRFGRYWNEIDEKGWYWREPGDPGYIPERKQPWTSFLRHWITWTDRDTEWVDLKLPEENGSPGGPLKWNAEQFRVITDDPKLCQRGFGFQFLLEDNRGDRADQEPILFIMRSDEWLYTIHFTKCADGYIASRAKTYIEELWGYKDPPCRSSTVALEIWEYINDLIDRKREWKESRRRKKQL
jgi:hypothetical protein